MILKKLSSIGILFFLLSVTSMGVVLHAQPAGTVLQPFNLADTGTTNGLFGYGTDITEALVDADGKYVLVGQFTAYNAERKWNIVRINPDFSLDNSFDAGTGTDHRINDILMQPDNKLVIGGLFSSYDGVARRGIARLLPDGSNDNTFNPGTGIDGRITSLAYTTDGKIIAAGKFSTYNGISVSNIVRLNSDGTIDPSFDTGLGFDEEVYKIRILSDGKILAVGDFQQFDGAPRSRIARLNTNGTLDTSFDPGTGFDHFAFDIAVQADGNYLIAGRFTQFNGVASQGLTRILNNGNRDPSLSISFNIFATVHAIHVEQNGNILIGGDFTSLNNTSVRRLARISSQGNIDISFSAGPIRNGIFNITPLDNDKYLITGNFVDFNSRPLSRVARIMANGTLDSGHPVSTGANSYISDALALSDGSSIIVGDFDYYDMTKVGKIARLLPDGTLDLTFQSGTGAGEIITSIARAPNGKVLIGGVFGSFNGTLRRSVARLMPDGSLDPSFNPPSGANIFVRDVIVDLQNRVYVVGDFDSYTGSTGGHVVRLLPDGSVDQSFQMGSGTNSGITSIALQPDGKILIGGSFTSYNGDPVQNLARINADGSLDNSFLPPLFSCNCALYFWAIEVQGDGKILIGGQFREVNATNSPMVVRLNQDGSVDPSFDVGTGASNDIRRIQIQSDGKILIGGSFSNVNGITRYGVARLLSNGTLDPNMIADTNIFGVVFALTTLADGNILLGGEFYSTNDAGRTRLAKIKGDAAPTMFNPIFQVSNPDVLTGITGDEYNVDIYLSNVAGQGVTSANFKVTYDPKILHISRNMASLEGGIMADASATLNDQTLGELVVSMANPLGSPISADGLLIRLGGYFLSEGDPQLRIVPRESPHDPMLPATTLPAVFPPLPYTGTVTGPPAVALSVGSATTEIGTTVDIPISVSELSDRGVLGFVLELSYDPAAVTFASSASTVVRTGSIIGPSGRTSVQVDADNVAGRLRIAASTTGSDGVYFSGQGLFFTLRGTAGSQAGTTALAMPFTPGVGGSYLNSNLPYQITAGSLTILPVLAAVAPEGLTANPTLVNTEQGTWLTATLSASPNGWASFALDQAGTYTMIASVEDGSEADLDPASGKVRVWVPNSAMGADGTYTFRGWQNNRQVTLSSQLQNLGTPGSVVTTATVVPAPAIYGNVDGDGMLSPVDVSYLLQYIVSLRSFTTTQLNWVDVNFDGNVNSLDASFLLQKLLTPAFCLPASGVCPPGKETAEQTAGLAWHAVTIEGRSFYELRLAEGGAISVDLAIEGLTNADRDWVTAPESWMSAFNMDADMLRLALAGSEVTSEGTPILRIPSSAVADWSAVSFTAAQLDGADVEAPLSPGVTTSIDDETSVPSDFAVEPNYPNPFNPSTTLRVNLPQTAAVSVTVYDLTGRVVMQLPARSLQAGRHSITLDASNLSTGVYIYRVSTGNWMASGKMTLVK